MYSQKVLRHFKNPKNQGRIKNPDGVGKVGNIVCGDVMWMYIRVGQNKKGEDILKDIKFETFGCVAAIANSSMTTEMVKGKTIAQALNIDKKSVVSSLGGLPPIKLHCSVLAVDALSEAIYDYLVKNGKKIPSGLAKRHEKIARENRIMEKKYSAWLDSKKEN